MKTLVISNQKGGVGKTTISVHIALQAVSMGLKTLFVDLDVQANSSQFFNRYLGSETTRVKSSAILNTTALFNNEYSPTFPSDAEFVLFEAKSDLADLEMDVENWINNLQKMGDLFDLCIIDTPPTLGLSQVASMVVADYILSPIELSSYSVQGASNLLTTLNNIRDNYNPKLKFLGLLPSRVNKTNNRQLALLAELKHEYEHLMYPNQQVIPERQAFAESSYLNLPVWEIKEHSARKVSTKTRPVFTDIINRTMG